MIKRYFLVVLVILCGKSLFSQPLTGVFPKETQNITDTVVQFEWNKDINAVEYHLQVANDSLFINVVLFKTGIIRTYYSDTLQPGSRYFWRVRADYGTGFSSWSRIYAFQIFTPKFLSGLVLWLSADKGIIKDTSNHVSSWQDLSGLMHHASQPGSNNQPLFTDSAIGSKSTLRFNGIDQFMVIPHFAFNNHTLVGVHQVSPENNTYALLSKIDNWVQDGFVWFKSNLKQSSYYFPNATYLYSGKNYPVQKPAVDILTFNGSSRQFFLNGASHPAQSTPGFMQNSQPLYLGVRNFGGSNAWHYKGDIAEIIIYDNALSDSARTLLESYIYQKYFPLVNLGKDIDLSYSFCDVELDAGYGYALYLWSDDKTTRKNTFNQQGSYWVNITDEFGRVSSDTIALFNSKPVLDVKDTTFCFGTSTTINTTFGNDYNILWYDSATTPQKTIAQPGTYWVKVSDTLGCFAADTFQVFVDSFPIVASLGQDVSVCAGNKIGLVNGAGEASNWLWSTGSTDSTIVIDTAGSYSVTVTNTRGCVSVDIISVEIHGITPVVKFHNDSVCLGNGTVFTDSSCTLDASSIISRKWKFGDNDSSSVKDPTHLYAQSGTFNVTLTVSTDSGCFNRLTKTAFVYPLPESFFVPLTGCSDDTIIFTDNSISNFGNLAKWGWDFGDTASGINNFSSSQNPFHIFDTAGSYSVKLLVETTAGCRDSITQSVTIKESPEPDFSSTSTCFGGSVYFADITPSPAINLIIERNWDFGDGNSATLNNPVYTFSSPFTHFVTLWVKSLNGCEALVEKPVYINARPVSDFNVDTSCVNTPVNFFDKSKVDSSVIASWQWDFGTYGTSTLQNPVITYQDTGAYPVQLIVFSPEGCSDTAVKTIAVYPLPLADFDFNPEFGEPPLNVSFTDNSSGAFAYLWDFGDGSQSTLSNPSHTYTAKGIYEVVLHAYTEFNCTDSKSKSVYVLQPLMDVAILKLMASLKNHYLTVSAEIINLGNNNIRNLDLKARIENGGIIREQWSGLLEPGNVLNYVFNAQFETENANYVCLTVSIPDFDPDIDSLNNMACKEILDEFIVTEPYPNPVHNEQNLGIFLPEAGEIEIILYGQKSEKIRIIYSGSIKKGYSNFIIPVYDLGQGVYAYTVKYRDKFETRRFIKF